jgi:hypothetical protein
MAMTSAIEVGSLNGPPARSIAPRVLTTSSMGTFWRQYSSLYIGHQFQTSKVSTPASPAPEAASHRIAERIASTPASPRLRM